MKKRSYGGILVILFVSLLALCCGAVCGMNHIGEDFSRQVIPISVSTPIEVIHVIDEKNFEAEDITIKLYIPKPVVKTNSSNNTTNTTSNTTNITRYNNTTSYNYSN